MPDRLNPYGLNRATNLKQATTTLGTGSYNNRGLPLALAWRHGTVSANTHAFGCDVIGCLRVSGDAA